MNRNEFLKKAAQLGLASGCMVLAKAKGAASQTQENSGVKMKKCKITVLKRTINKDIPETYLASENVICDRFKDGQEFIIDSSPFIVPKGFCQWAWADIRYDILSIALGGKRPYMNPPDVTFASCTDVFRPVIFKIEAI